MYRHGVCHKWDRNRYDLNSSLLWQWLMFALMFHFSITANIVIKKVTLGIKCKFSPKIIAINIVIVVNS